MKISNFRSFIGSLMLISFNKSTTHRAEHIYLIRKVKKRMVLQINEGIFRVKNFNASGNKI